MCIISNFTFLKKYFLQLQFSLNFKYSLIYPYVKAIKCMDMYVCSKMILISAEPGSPLL